MDEAVVDVVAGDELVGESRLFCSPQLADLLEAEIAAAREGAGGDEDEVPGGLLDVVPGGRGPATTVKFLPVP